MRMRPLMFLAALSLVACGGGSKAADTTPAGEELEATPVAPAAEADPAPEPAPAETASNGGDACATVCDHVLACAVELSGQPPTDEQMAEAKQMCNAQCAEEAPDRLDAARACVDANPDSCPGLMECVQKIPSSES